MADSTPSTPRTLTVTRRSTPLDRSAKMTVYRRANMNAEAPELYHTEYARPRTHFVMRLTFSWGEDAAKTVLPFASMHQTVTTTAAAIAFAAIAGASTPPSIGATGKAGITPVP